MMKLSLGIPGHSIVVAGLPMALRVSLAPRRLAGSVMSAGALGTMDARPQLARLRIRSIVSLLLIGPMMDIALGWARTGWRVYAALLLAGVAANLLALGSRSATKVLGLDTERVPSTPWWLQALITYPLSGAIAGIVGALFLVLQRPGAPTATGVTYIGIDDTDIIGSPGTNQLARAIVGRLGRRRQRLDRVPAPAVLRSTRSIHQSERLGIHSAAAWRADRQRRTHRNGARRDACVYVEGSDPGLAVSTASSTRMSAFAARAKSDVVSQEEALAIAAESACHLEGLGGSNQGIIGALAAVALPNAATMAASFTWNGGRGPIHSPGHSLSATFSSAASTKSVPWRDRRSPAARLTLGSICARTGGTGASCCSPSRWRESAGPRARKLD